MPLAFSFARGSKMDCSIELDPRFITPAEVGQLGQAGLTADELRTKATVSMEKVEGGFSITAVHLDLVAKIPGASQEAFDKAATTAKENCPVSKLLNAKITLDARLEN